MNGPHVKWAAALCSFLRGQPAVEKGEALLMAADRVSQEDTSHKLNKNTTAAVFMYLGNR